MKSLLYINIPDLLRLKGIESMRVEFKTSWDAKTTGYQVMKTITAFANDYQNINGGYIVIGVDAKDGIAEFPPKGVDPQQLESIQKQIRSMCKTIDPEYQPIQSPEIIDGKHILVIWVPGSDIRPHRAPDGEKREKKFWVRIGCETIDASNSDMILHTLLESAAKIPYDSRRALNARIEDIRIDRVREFLRDVSSWQIDNPDANDIYRHMKITAQINNHEVPLNSGLLFFSDSPELWFPGARIEIVHFTDTAGGNIQEERIFRGPLHTQLRDCINYLSNFTAHHLEKQSTDITSKSWVNYPLAALREAIVNAVYHRSYENCIEPVKVYIYPEKIEIISYPGPVPGIFPEHIKPGHSVPPVPARNRRIGEFLKELRLAEARGTGLPKIFQAMNQNGSPDPRFDFDESRSYFRVTLPAHS